VNSDPLEKKQEKGLVAAYPENPSFVEQKQVTAQPLVIAEGEKAAVTATPVPEITPTPAPEITAEPVQEGANRLLPTPLPGEHYLPICDRALRTPSDQMMIAITVDDCSKAEVMNEIVAIARKYDVALTLFPTGEALMNESLQEGFRMCVNKYGYQLENHTHNHKPDYTLSNGELAMQIWKQGIAASYVVGRDYTQHFYRPVKHGSEVDQRTHFYLRKLGYVGIGSYTYSYVDNTVEELAATLENGNIYQFDMTQKSMAVFEGFIQAACDKGYKLVTMNELFGLEQDVVGSSLTIDQQTLVTMDDYSITYFDLKLNDRASWVYNIQRRLIDLGYIDGELNQADGLYGPKTSMAVSEFQANVGLPATGNADIATQEKLFSSDAPAR
ncbi:MAG: peptidoglycan-binding protein, partial [Clostridia bacterium]|nr:peptidoglycan-binding protein [Clostridia bacterium]